MHLLKNTVSVAAVFLISMSALSLRIPETVAENEPLDVHLTIETKEIDISEIPDDRIVYLEISVENAPPFKGLTMYLDKDPRLKFNEPKPFKPAEGAENIGSINFISYLEIAPDVLGCGVPAKGSRMIDHSGALITTELILPEDVQAGDFYYLNFSPYLGSSYMVIDLSIFPEDRYGLDSFTELNDGGIYITDNAPSAPPAPHEPEPPARNDSPGGEPADTNGNSGAPESPVHDNSNNTPDAADTPVTTSKSNNNKTATTTSVSAASPTTASSVSTALSSTTSAASISTSSSSTSSSAPETTADSSIEDPDNKNKAWITAGLITLGVIALSSTAVFSARSKRKK